MAATSHTVIELSNSQGAENRTQLGDSTSDHQPNGTVTGQVAIDINESSPSNSQRAENGIQVGNSTSVHQPNGLDLPDSYLLTSEGRQDYLRYGVKLYGAAMKGDVDTVGQIISEHPEVVGQSITEGMETVVHIAAIKKQVQLVEKLVNQWVTPQVLRLQNTDGNTALSYVAISGIDSLARLMVERNPELPKIRNNGGVTPLHLAALLGHRDMVPFLFERTDEVLNEGERHGIFIICIRTGLYDVALRMQDRQPGLATYRCPNYEIALHVLAQTPALLSNSENRFGLLRRIISPSGVNHDSSMQDKILELVKSLWEKVLELNHEEMWSRLEHPTILTLDAAKSGNAEFLVQLINLYPDLIFRVDNENQSIFHYAILYRHESVFSLIYEIGSIKEVIATYKDENGNNMLHLAARLPPQNRLHILSGAALQMQRELFWFKEVERVVGPSGRGERNSENKTPWELFMKTHNDLMEDGEKWMKKTAQSLLVVPTLIAAAVFASIFNVPGGLDDKTGEPQFLEKMPFTVFVIPNAVALFSSLASILMFLSILTSHYTEHNFMK